MPLEPQPLMPYSPCLTDLEVQGMSPEGRPYPRYVDTAAAVTDLPRARGARPLRLSRADECKESALRLRQRRRRRPRRFTPFVPWASPGRRARDPG